MTEPQSQQQQQQHHHHAHIHIDAFLALPDKTRNVVTIRDGSQLTAATFERLHSRPILVQDSPESIGLRVEPLSVRNVASIVGPLMPVRVIDVRYQEELAGWRLGDLADYFEDRQRDRMLDGEQRDESSPVRDEEDASAPLTASRLHLARSSKTLGVQKRKESRILNQISLEISMTPLAGRIVAPQFVSDLSWANQAWPKNQPKQQAQLYCLTSAAGSYTDFHVDFGGTTVWYHVVSGEKQFVLMEPSASNLQVYEQWICSNIQEATFLPMLMTDADDYVKVTLRAGETMVIPSGWIHAVYTSEDSVVFGGNFLHGMDMHMQLTIHAIEARSKVPSQMRFPHFEELHFYAACMYLKQLREKCLNRAVLSELPSLIQALSNLWHVHAQQSGQPVGSTMTIRSAAVEAALLCGCSGVREMLSCLHGEYERACGVEPSTTVLPSPPRVRLKLSLPQKESTTAKTTKKKTTSTGKGFRIKLSTSSTRASEIPRDIATITPSDKEDTDWIDESGAYKNDDEWMPMPAAKKPPVKRRLCLNNGPNASKSSSKQGSTNARERLFKKLR